MSDAIVYFEFGNCAFLAFSATLWPKEITCRQNHFLSFIRVSNLKVGRNDSMTHQKSAVTDTKTGENWLSVAAIKMTTLLALCVSSSPRDGSFWNVKSQTLLRTNNCLQGGWVEKVHYHQFFVRFFSPRICGRCPALGILAKNCFVIG